jgi:hypothetical protein
MELNPGLDPRTLQAGQTINLITLNADTTISAATLAAYGASDAGYQADREQQARAVSMQAESASVDASYNRPDITRQSAEPESGGGIAEGRASMRAYWESVQNNAVKEGSFLTYLGANIMGKLGEVGYGLAERGVAAYNDPEGALIGAGKGVVNFGPEAFNAAVNLTKTSLNGYTLLAEAAGVPSGTFAGFRETDPYNLTPAATYNSKAEEGGALLANLAMAAGVAKYGNVKLGGAADSGPLRFTQTTASPVFSEEGIFAGRRIGEVAQDLRSGAMTADQVPVEFIVRDGNRLVVNTRSSLALRQAGIPESQWNLIDKTAVPEVQARITERLLRNQLDNAGTSTLRITGSGKNVSNLR